VEIQARQFPAYLTELGRPTTSMDVENVRDIQGLDGNFYTGDEILEAIFETLKSALDYFAYLRALPPQPDNTALPHDIEPLIRLFNLHAAYKADWEECLWLGNDIDVDEKRMWQNPALVARAIGLSREFSLRFQHILHGNILSSKVARYRFLDGRLARSRKVTRDFEKFRVSTLKHIPYPFLSHMVKMEMEKRSEIAHIIDLYLLLTFISIGNIKRLAAPYPTDSFVFSSTEFERYIGEQLALSHKELADALMWLTFSPRQRQNIWFTPLSLVEDYYVLFSPMCAYANFERFVESIFARTERLSSGKAFEHYVTARVQAAVKNPRLPKLIVVGSGVYKGQREREEIDLLIICKTVVFVGEVKYDCFPADEIHVYRHIEKMKGACDQARRKAKFVSRNWTSLAASFNLQPSASAFHPFALTEKPFLSGFSFNGVPILALRDFEDFFQGEIWLNVVIGRNLLPSGGDVVPTFRNAETMADDLLAYMAAPVRTANFIDRLCILKFHRAMLDSIPHEYNRLQFEVA
jgi:hypothetical protein